MLSLLPLPVLEPGHTHKTLNNYLGIGIDAKVALEFHCIRLEREREKERERVKGKKWSESWQRCIADHIMTRSLCVRLLS